jgi:hypothetical protein
MIKKNGTTQNTSQVLDDNKKRGKSWKETIIEMKPLWIAASTVTCPNCRMWGLIMNQSTHLMWQFQSFLLEQELERNWKTFLFLSERRNCHAIFSASWCTRPHDADHYSKCSVSFLLDMKR